MQSPFFKDKSTPRGASRALSTFPLPDPTLHCTALHCIPYPDPDPGPALLRYAKRTTRTTICTVLHDVCHNCPIIWALTKVHTPHHNTPIPSLRWAALELGPASSIPSTSLDHTLSHTSFALHTLSEMDARTT